MTNKIMLYNIDALMIHLCCEYTYVIWYNIFVINYSIIMFMHIIILGPTIILHSYIYIILVYITK